MVLDQWHTSPSAGGIAAGECSQRPGAASAWRHYGGDQEQP